MLLIETCSVAEAGLALGLRPAAVCQRIRSGEITAVRIGRAWRVMAASVNALLSGLPPSSPTPTTQAIPEPTPSAKPSPSATPSAQGIPAIASPGLPIFTRDDDPQIERCRDMLLSSNDNDRLVARWILDKHARFGGSVTTPAPPVSRYTATDFANLF